ncbi:MAG TPA: hypothetical protein VGL86_20735, partial [Polyangia bacterium]
CGTQTCAPGAGGAVVTPVGACNGGGSCTQVANPACSYTMCSGNNCATSCTDDTGCVAADYCGTAGGGTCVVSHGNGVDCTPEDCEHSPCGFCKAMTSCQPSGQCCKNTCAAPSCAGGMLTTNTCGGGGNCNPTTTSCGGYQCNGMACGTTCAADTDCVSTYYCDSTGHCSAETLNSMDTCDNTVCYMGGACRQCKTDKACMIPPGKCP